MEEDDFTPGPDDEDTIAADPDEPEEPFEEDDSEGDDVGENTEEK